MSLDVRSTRSHLHRHAIRRLSREALGCKPVSVVYVSQQEGKSLLALSIPDWFEFAQLPEGLYVPVTNLQGTQYDIYASVLEHVHRPYAPLCMPAHLEHGRLRGQTKGQVLKLCNSVC